MIAIDTNLLVYAHRRDAAFHGEALAALRQIAEGVSPWAIPWPCAHEFLAIVTHPRIYDPPSTVTQACDQLAAWAESPSSCFLSEARDHLARLRDLIQSGAAKGPQVHDARVAAICLGHRVTELWTVDRDFSRFPALRVRNPLAG